MCPACVAMVMLVTAGVGGTGVLGVVAAKTFRPKLDAAAPASKTLSNREQEGSDDDGRNGRA